MSDACIVRIAAPSELWLQSRPRISQTVTDVIVLAVQRSGKVHSLSEVSVVLSDDRELRILNNEHRGIDKPTNVLAFPGEPLEEEGEQSAYTVRDKPLVLGDVVIAHETVEREAAEQGKKFEHHLTHLLVHGVLHLCGFDHERAADAQKMEDLERAILRELHIHDPYAEHIIAEMTAGNAAAQMPPAAAPKKRAPVSKAKKKAPVRKVAAPRPKKKAAPKRAQKTVRRPATAGRPKPVGRKAAARKAPARKAAKSKAPRPKRRKAKR